MNQATRKKGISAKRRLDTSTYVLAKGGCRWSILVTIRGQKKLYKVEPALYMDPKFWVAQTDPSTGRMLKEKTIFHGKGNPNSRYMERELALAEAKIWDAINAIMKSGSDPTHKLLEAKLKITGHDTFADSCRIYIDSRIHLWDGGKDGGTYKRNKWIVGLLEQFDPSILLAAVDIDWISRFQRWMLEEAPNTLKKGGRGFAASTVNGILYFLGEIFKEANSDGRMDKNPYLMFLSSKRKIPNRVPEAQALNAQEIDRLQTAWSTQEFLITPKPNSRPSVASNRLHESLQQILICIYSGFRYSELKKLENPDSFKIAESHLSLITKKNKISRTVKVTKRLESVLMMQKKGAVLIGPVPKNDTLNRRLRSILEKLGVPNPKMKLHGMRKTFVSILYAMSGDLNAVSKAVGHRAITTTEKHYLATNTSHVDWVVDKFDSLGAKQVITSEEILTEVHLMVKENPSLALPPKLATWLELHCKTHFI